MDYDFSGLGARHFEQLTQAVARRVLGQGLEVMGDGPDGGREASWRGAVRFPEPTHGAPWVGYGVLQAKYRQRSEGTRRDTEWLITHIREELRAWAGATGARGRGTVPDYLLIATNVVLSPQQERGGIDRVHAALAETVAQLKLSIRDWRVWHFDSLCTYLDQFPEVRRPYAALTTAGDVLSALRDRLAAHERHVAERAMTYAMMQLESNQWVRLGQAGHGDNQRLPLADLAVDLTASTTDLAHRAPSLQAPSSLFDDSFLSDLDAFSVFEGLPEQVRVVAHVLRQGEEILRSSVSSTRFVHRAILGGPGQGKTTLTQMICQAYRVAVLSPSTVQLSQAQQATMSALRARFDQLGLSIPQHRRWPVHIDLPSYAAHLVEGQQVSVLQRIADQINACTPQVTANDVRTWLGAWPWLMVFDGLDEVASPQARQQVFRAVEQFLTEIRQADGDVLVIATSRPQGYLQELSALDFRHLHLVPLEAHQAVEYGHQVAQARFSDDPAIAAQIAGRLAVAAQDDLTARLMRTPLQITVMSVLLEHRERPPQERHRLFGAYYDTLYQRELSKPGPTSQLLHRYRYVVDRLHERTGLALQVSAEQEDGSESIIRKDALSELALQIMIAEGHADTQATRALVAQIVDVCLNRIVLLSARGDDEDVAFDVRSLQEFMAAREICRAPDTDVVEHLSRLAHSAHWRNTWLLAAGWVFYQQPRSRGPLIAALRELQSRSPAENLVNSGGILAASLIDDDVASTQPRYLRLLLQQAIELLTSPTCPTDLLADALQRAVELDAECHPFIDHALEASLDSTNWRFAVAYRLLERWSHQQGPLSTAAREKLAALQRPDPAYVFPPLTPRPRTLGEITEFNLHALIAPYLPPSAGLDAGVLDACARALAPETVLLHSPFNGYATILDRGEPAGLTAGASDALTDPAVRNLIADTARRLPYPLHIAAAQLIDLCTAYLQQQPAGQHLLTVLSLSSDD
ncbi:NACHT domain-containing protein [Streptomyces sp. NPDC056669]|uniref:NACHT domain-containing protein n=1 Tax=Streptomyces sp. NPDC056669 TaxID=3345903 RepID=UPI00367997E9